MCLCGIHCNDVPLSKQAVYQDSIPPAPANDKTHNANEGYSTVKDKLSELCVQFYPSASTVNTAPI